MTKEILKSLSKEEVLKFIRQRLAFNNEIVSQFRYTDSGSFENEHRRFEMSGYEDRIGACTLHNSSIVNEFADLGIYDYTNYLFVDFHQGNGIIYLKYFYESLNLEIEVGGLGTSEIIHLIFEKTIFSDKELRRRMH